MAHLSDFTQQRQAETERLLSELVCATLRAEPGDDVHEAGLEWSLASVVWHQYPDVNPTSVDAQYESLGNRFGTNALFSKQAMLGRLVEALHRQRLQEGTLETHHSILSAILCLAGKPLQHNYQPTAAALACVQDVNPDRGHLGDACSEASALSHWDDSDCGAASSRLSDWGESNSEPDTSEDKCTEDQGLPQTGAAALGKHSAMAAMLELGQLGGAPKPEKLPVNSKEVPELGDGCLLRRVVEVRAQGRGLSLPPPELGFMESDLVHQILHMLRGCPCPGKAICLDRALDAFTVAPGVHVAYFSPTCLSHVLRHWVRWGTTAFRLQVFSAAVRKAAASADGSENSPIKASTTLAAYATAFATELDHVEHEIIRLQDTYATHSCTVPRDNSAVNLAALDLACRGIVRRMGMLECVAGSISIAGPGLRTAAQQGVSALDGLHRLLLPAADDSTPQGREFAAVLRRLLLAALKPSVDRLQLWVEEGFLEDYFDEFLICTGGQSISIRSSDFWRDAFYLRTDDRGSLLCPELFRGVAEDVLEAGKAALLLRTEHRCRDGTSLPPAASAGASLHAEMQQRLQCQARLGPLAGEACDSHSQVHADAYGESAPVQGTIAERMAALSARPSDWHLSSLALPEPSAAFKTGTSDTDNTLMYDLPQAEEVMAHSLTAASLQQPSSSHWHLSRFLTMGSAQARTEASHQVSKQLTPSSCSQGPQQSTHEDQTLSSQQENQSTGSPRPHHQQAEARRNNSPWRHSAGILGDVSNVMVTREQDAKSFPKQSSPAVLQVLPVEAEDSQVGKSDSSACPLSEISASATQAINCRTDSFDKQHGLRQVDDLLRDWYDRTLQSICSATCLPAAVPEPDSARHHQRTGSHRLHSVLVAAQKGTAIQQMWGVQWRSFAGEAAGAGSMDALADADLAPAQALLEACVLAPLLERADRSRQALMKQVTGAWAMQQHINALWQTLFLASPAMQPFLSTAHAMLAASHRDGVELRAADLQGALDMTLSDAEQSSMLPSSSVTVHLEEPVSESAGMGDQFRGLRLDVRLPWPLTLVVQDTQLRQYNAIFAVLLQVHLAGKALNEVYSSACADGNRRGGGLDRAGVLAMSMRCYLGAYLGHVMGHLVDACASNLQQAIASASSLEEIIAAHEHFLTDASVITFTAPQQSSKLLHNAHCRLLSLVWEFATTALSATAQRAAHADPYSGDLSGLWEAWQDRRRYMERLLNGCAVRASPCSGLKELAASISLDCNAGRR